MVFLRISKKEKRKRRTKTNYLIKGFEGKVINEDYKDTYPLSFDVQKGKENFDRNERNEKESKYTESRILASRTIRAFRRRLLLSRANDSFHIG